LLWRLVGRQRLGYLVRPNDTGKERAGILNAGGIEFRITQAAAGGVPHIAEGGIVNAASFMLASSPGAGIAAGSMISIFGENLGPTPPVQAKTFPLPTQLGGVSVKISQGDKSWDAILVLASSGQINAILPSKSAAGESQVRVTYQLASSDPAPITILSANFGIFSVLGEGAGPGIIQNYNSARDQPLNGLTHPARPGQFAVLWGTGLGAVTGSDAVAPPARRLSTSVQLTVGGKPAKISYSGRAPCCAGVDEIVFSVPEDAPTTCYVPVQVKTGPGTYSNVVTMAVRAQPGPCTDSSPFTPLLLNGGNTAWIQLMRANVAAPLDPTGSASLKFTADAGLAMFRKLRTGGEFAFDVLYSMPSIGTCTTYAGNLGLAGEQGFAQLLGLTAGQGLDAGPDVSISGSAAAAHLVPSAMLPNTYFGVLGGSIPLSGGMLPLFLDPGRFIVSSQGGKDAGPFRADITLADAAVWSNRDQIAAVDRSQGVTLNWTGGNDTTQLAMIGGLSNSSDGKASGAFFCLAHMAQGNFTVPVAALANLPASPLDFQNFSGFLFFGTVPTGASVPNIKVPGLDSAFVIHMSLFIKAVGYK
jgi:uncharacterized protein (TIGR03437 family)